VLLQACINGSRAPAEHPRCPVTPAQLADDAAAVAAAGAGAVHLHPRDDEGAETLEAGHVAAAVAAVRERVAVPVGVTTGAWTAPDPADRLRHIRAWAVLPDVASVNFHEPGAPEVARLLLERGVAVEAGIWAPDGAEVLLGSGLAERCVRLLLEPMDPDVDTALRDAAAIDSAMADVPASVPRLLHGEGATAWPVLEEAVRRGFEVRMGLEDTLRRPDGTVAAGNADLVALARARLVQRGRRPAVG
jgi:uncharacterized protein (DUF849 family)